MTDAFKLTYATMFDPPPELHKYFEAGLSKIKSGLGKEYGMFINGQERYTSEKVESRSPVNPSLVLGIFQKGAAKEAQEALYAARKAFPTWSRMKWQDRVALMRKAADLIDARIYEIGAATSLEVGKNRMEALGDVAETPELIRYTCNQMEKHDGYIVKMNRDPVVGYVTHNFSILRPYGVWLVISPFNFPAALSGGPSGAALVAGNTVVLKPASGTPWVARLLAECFRDAGLPEGVFNYVTGPGSTLGQALISSPEVDGVTFTGSYDVGMKIYRDFANGVYPRPVILEMGGKNPAIVSHNADLERAAIGIVRSAFGLQGQKCSACSRVYVEKPVYDEFVERLVKMTEKLTIGDPTDRNVYLGPVINQNSYSDYQNFSVELAKSGRILTGGKILTEGDLGKGYFCAPTIAVDVPFDHRLWKHEMFLPIVLIGKVNNLEEALQYANQVTYGLTAGFYGSQEEGKTFFNRVAAGVLYLNRPQGATTGAWPGYQPFGGWKGSGSSGKNAGGHYYLPLYMHEQIHSVVE